MPYAQSQQLREAVRPACRADWQRPKRNGAIWANQFDNVANRQAHIEGTGPEIWDQTGGKVDGFICAVGSGGTLGGVAHGAERAQQEYPHRPCRSDGGCDLQLVHDRRAEIAGLVHHRRHRPGPRHQQSRRRADRRRLSNPGRGSGADHFRSARARRALPRRLDRHQCRRRDAARQGARAGPHHRDRSWPITARAISRNCSIPPSCARRSCRCRNGSSARPIFPCLTRRSEPTFCRTSAFGRLSGNLHIAEPLRSHMLRVDNTPPPSPTSRFLVSTEWLAERLNDPNLIPVDGSYFLPMQKRDALAEYRAGAYSRRGVLRYRSGQRSLDRPAAYAARSDAIRRRRRRARHRRWRHRRGL